MAAVGEIAVIGDVYCDIILRGVARMPRWGEEIFGSEPVMCPGGAANVAVGTARLGVDTRLLARTKAEDTIGNVLAAELDRQEHLRVRWLHRADSTALTVALPMGSERAMISYVPAADGRPLAPHIPWDDLRRVSHLHLGGWSEGARPLEDQMAILSEARGRGVMTSLDVSLQSEEDRVPRLLALLEHVDVFLPNRAEACQVAGCEDPEEALIRLRDHVPTVVIKLGADGAIGVGDGEVERAPARPAQTVDTTGAGDAFAAGFLYGHVRRWPLARCLRFGNVCGAIAVSRIGSSISAPSRREAFSALEASRSVHERVPTTPA